MSKYTRFYIVALSLIAAFILITYFVISGAINRQSDDAAIINMSGKQRMLSQRAALLSAQLIYPQGREEALANLESTINQMESAHYKLTYNDHGPSSQFINSATVERLYFHPRIEHYHEGTLSTISVDELMHRYVSELKAVLEYEDSAFKADDAGLKHVINDYHNKILPYLDEITKQYELENAAKIRELQRTEMILVIATLLLLLFEAAFIFRPMVSHIKHSTKELQKANQSLRERRHQEKLASLGHLSSSLVHEINNHLQPIIGISAILKTRVEDKQIADHLSILERNALQTRNIMRNVLSFSRSAEETTISINIRDLLIDIIDFSRSVILSSVKIETAESFENNSYGNISCDTTSVTQVFINIFKNASDAMDGAGTIIIDAEQKYIDHVDAQDLHISEGYYVVISVKDSGIGMTPKTLERLCDPYFTTKEKDNGTGLGMSTSMSIMKQHHGCLSAQSEIGAGTTLFLYFPINDYIPNTAEDLRCMA